MLYLLALVLPPLACLCAGRFWHAVLSLFLCATVVCIPIAMIHAWCVVRGVEERRHGNVVNIYR